ncbi:MAG: hypothetical protein HY819_09475 [Acidobacteria bacterium]|nr:hypothetical protein [Acidobacteriota bacterium]
MWLNIAAKIAENHISLSIMCPSCDKATIDFQYVGNPESKIGYLDVWCKGCLQGIHISRVKIPDNISFLPFDTPEEVFLKRIPNFKEVS